MTLFFYIIIGLITFVAFLHAWSKKTYDLNRIIIINRPKAEVYAYIRQLQKQPLWMQWYRENPNVITKFKGEDGKLGASSYWKGDHRKTGEGIQRITKIKEGKLMETQLLFLKPYKSISMQYFAVKEVEPERTKLVWGIRGSHKFPASVVTLFYSLEKAIGKHFDVSLQNLKKNLESK
ncbi:SRPBCC family protein [Salinimicrobium sp. GXAS 041]|uniref:SRPBCC family protein n=1 Tax=Salinimicrobium sp. GXAS 041 TaxID=3400806 RepID=UPI003C7675F3